MQGSTISSENVSELKQIWTVPITGGGTFGNYASTPIVLDGVVFTQEPHVQREGDRPRERQGHLEAEFDSSSVGPNGVAVADGPSTAPTADSVFALDAKTGDSSGR